GPGVMSLPWRLPVAALLLLAGCGEQPKSPATKPSKSDPVGRETELLKLTLTPQAEKRLAIRTAVVGTGTNARVRATHGEIVAPTGSTNVPVRSVTDLAELSSALAEADGDIARARPQVELAQLNYDRAERLVGLQSGSARARDEARAELGIARAALAAASAQRRLLGPSMAAMAVQTALWVRVPVSSGDLDAIVQDANALVRPLGSGVAPHIARPVRALPSSDADAGTVDLYFTLANADRAFRVGQRVGVELPMRGASSGLVVPAAAIIRDIYGGEWVYQRVAPQQFERRRVEVAATTGASVLLARGLEPGAIVVTAGAAELFGTEFGAK
ncbi:MAG: efflux RND transporter periplasmic adaptor subunit, partial [Polymorphobacter sp.]